MAKLYVCKFKAVEFNLDKSHKVSDVKIGKVNSIIQESGGKHRLATVQGWAIDITTLSDKEYKFELTPPYSKREMLMTNRQYKRFQTSLKALAIHLLGDSIKITRGGNLTLTETCIKSLSDTLIKINAEAENALDHNKVDQRHREDNLVFVIMPIILVLLTVYVMFKIYS